MSDLISRQSAIDALAENKEMINAVLDSLTLDYNTRRNEEQRRGQINEDIETIKALPTAMQSNESNALDALERTKGKWIEQEDGWGGYYYDCSVCKESWTTIDGTPWDNGMNFCPNCGAEMER